MTHSRLRCLPTFLHVCSRLLKAMFLHVSVQISFRPTSVRTNGACYWFLPSVALYVGYHVWPASSSNWTVWATEALLSLLGKNLLPFVGTKLLPLAGTNLFKLTGANLPFVGKNMVHNVSGIEGGIFTVGAGVLLACYTGTPQGSKPFVFQQLNTSWLYTDLLGKLVLLLVIYTCSKSERAATCHTSE